jgi:predicted peptidase
MLLLHRYIVMAGCVGIMGLSITGAQTPSSVMQLRKHKGAAMTLYYHLFKPGGYSNVNKYPAVIALHGVGEDGDSTSTLYIDKNGLVSNWVSTAFQTKHPCFVIAPHNPSGTWTDTAWTVSNTVCGYKQGPISARLGTVMQILDSMEREFPLDTNRIYITGLSIGGWATWDLVTRFPDKFAAAFPQSGGVDTGKAGVVAQVPIWCYHGKQDGVVAPLSDNFMMDNIDKVDGNKGVVFTWCHGNTCPAKMSEAKIDSLTKAGMIHFYTLDPNRSHDGWDQYYGDTLIQNWLMKQSRTGTTAVFSQNIPVRVAGGCQQAIMVSVAGLWNQPAWRSGYEVYNLRGKRISGEFGHTRVMRMTQGVVVLMKTR